MVFCIVTYYEKDSHRPQIDSAESCVYGSGPYSWWLEAWRRDVSANDSEFLMFHFDQGAQSTGYYVRVEFNNGCVVVNSN